MKYSRTLSDYRSDASQLHQKVGQSLQQGIFKDYKIYQEYPVFKLNPLYLNKRDRYDWVILDLKLIIEIMGQQHFIPINFGNASNEQAIDNMMNQKYRDKRKEQAAIDAGYTYIVVPFSDSAKISSGYILDLYNLSFNKETADKSILKDKRKQYRRESYRKYKEFLKSKKEQRCNNETIDRYSRSNATASDQKMEDPQYR